MYDLEYGSEIDMDRFEEEMIEQYDEYREETCGCSGEECECMSLSEFKNKYMKELAEYWEGDEQDYEENYAC